jgi:glycosyltransferase involved in cell wall biosynthesis
MVSIIMATYNRASTLRRAVESVLGQTYSDWELIIIDDGSTDGTPDVLAGMTDPRIRVYRHSPNRGVAASRNVGFDRIEGEWFTMLDSDDEMVPDALAWMLECAERTGATAVLCNAMDSVTGEMSGTGPVVDGWLTDEDAAQCRGDHWGLTRTDLLGDKRFDERLPGSFENTLWLKINARARRYYLHRVLAVWHTEGSDRITATQRRTGIRRRVQIFSALGDDMEYLGELRAHDAARYRHTIVRIWAARVLHPILSGFGRGPTP